MIIPWFLAYFLCVYWIQEVNSQHNTNYESDDSSVEDESNGKYSRQQHGESISSIEKSIPGQPGVDYPTYARIPRTSFSCDGRVGSGYYADLETHCQVFHVCQTDGHKNSFLCPNGSVFNQKYSVCDWWYSFDCEATTHDIFSETFDVQKIQSTDKSYSDQASNEIYQQSEFHNANQQIEYSSGHFYNTDLNIASSGGNTPNDNADYHQNHRRKSNKPINNNNNNTGTSGAYESSTGRAVVKKVVARKVLHNSTQGETGNVPFNFSAPGGPSNGDNATTDSRNNEYTSLNQYQNGFSGYLNGKVHKPKPIGFILTHTPSDDRSD